MPITIFRHAHHPEYLNERLEGLIKEADILFIENADRKTYSQAEKYYNALSFGKTEPRFYTDDKYSRKHDSLIHKARKRIKVEKSPIKDKTHGRRAGALHENMTKTFFSGDLERALEIQMQYITHHTKFMIDKRDNSVAEQLKGLYNKNVGKNILVLFGAGHYFHYILREAGIETNHVLPHSPIVFSIRDELERRIKFGKPYTKDMGARSFVYNLVDGYLSFYSLVPEKECCKTSRAIAKSLDYEQIRELSEYLSLEDGDPTHNIIEWTNNMGISDIRLGSRF